MIDVTLLRPSSLRDIKAGEMFLATSSGMFLGGFVSNDPACVALEGSDPFHVAPVGEWSRPDGLIVASARFRVDPSSATNADEVDRLPGVLIKGSNGLFIMAAGGNSRYVVALQDAESESHPVKPRIAFTRWQIVAGAPDDETVLFSFPIEDQGAS